MVHKGCCLASRTGDETSTRGLPKPQATNAAIQYTIIHASSNICCFESVKYERRVTRLAWFSISDAT